MKLKTWANELQCREAEVAATLAYENVAAETLYAFQAGGETYVMGMQALTGEHRNADMSVELNRRHFAVMEECLEPQGGDVLYAFER